MTSQTTAQSGRTSGDSPLQQAILAGGCFWCTEAVMKDVRGVTMVESGYIGGQTQSPDYRSVCSGTTGHAEAVRVTFDPEQVSFKDLLGLFFATHDPTTLNRQGADTGTQYRSAVFPLTPEQERETREVIADLGAQNVFDRPIVTSIEPSSTFYVAEDYHQDYYARNPGQGYCMAVIAPKVAKLRKYYGEKLRA
ncbi:peptide-methionine (S)-S-oxide reductase MsrA [Deinococcus koreensis]|uniref:Peptide methionine sulfoxide reductase MsrA n=1 Tax=Deinococcus koreensis TaxID=2054903 RepID=A0A2K3V152_9DEIO|nr:peptide-methionine (S)-S-oxide reductase MsrA [Deinococcus koreensis]PNY82515.1 peptide-methionine (S)-S-oxide reductase [Deinococcus koreensis]